MDDYYQVLKLKKEDSPTQEQIKRQYLILAQEYHPDRQQTSDSHQFVQLQQAYEVLRDVKLRRAYDQERENQQYQNNKSNFGEISEFVRLSDMEFVNETRFVWQCRCSSCYELELSDIMKDNGEIGFDSILVHCNGCSLKIKVVNDTSEEDSDEEEDE